MSGTVEEILALLKDRPKYEKGVHCKSWAYNDVEYWFAKFVPKLEAFLKDRAVPKDVEEILLEKAKSSIGIYRQVLRWQETFRKGALGDHKAYNQARDGRSEIEEPNWVKLDDVKKIVEAQRAQLKKLIEELREMMNERSSGTIQAYDLIKEIVKRLEMLGK